MTGTVSPTTKYRPVMRSAVDPADRSIQKRWYRTTGVLFILGAILVNIPYTLLIANFEYPDILRRPTGEILTRFQAGGSGLIYTWLAFAWAGLPIVLGVMLLRRVVDQDRHPLIGPATTFGVVGGIVQIVGLLRWVFVVPGLATAYTATGASEATRSAAEVAFQAVHQYGGVALGEHLGQAFTIVWMVMVAAMMLRSRVFRPWLGWFGLAAAAVYSSAQLELLAIVVPDLPSWDPAGLLGSLMWLGWMLLMGIRLTTIKQPLSVTASSAGIERRDT